MARIILIETSTALCSVALAEDGRIVAYKESETPRAQASLTAPFVKDLLDERGIGVRDCDAVCVSKGPGSYTGLRVGVSTAKGLCFGAGIPLIAVGTLDTLVYQAVDSSLLSVAPKDLPSGTSAPFASGFRYIVPMVDARRMEVYTAAYNAALETVLEPQAIILDENSFADLLERGHTLVVMGNGSDKARQVLTHDRVRFITGIKPVAVEMLALAEKAWREQQFLDVAYSTPLYLKEFQATKPKNPVLGVLKTDN